MCIAPALACAIDAGLTLVFQPAAYWTGQFHVVNEVSPIDRWMLIQHPLAFFAWVAFWIAAFSVAIRCLPVPVGKVAALTLIFGNVSGAYSWIVWRVPFGFWVCLALYLLIAMIVFVTWRKVETE